MTNSTKDMFNVVDISNLMLTVSHPNGTLAKITAIGSLRLTSGIVLFDVLVVLEYNVVLLFVNKMIKDSKFIVSFDEHKCYIQNLKLCKIVGTGSETGGLFLFVVNKTVMFGVLTSISFHITFAMSTQQDIYAACFENRPPMLNKDNSFMVFRYSSLCKTDEELSDKEVKQMEPDDQAIQTILMEKIASNLKFLNNLQLEWRRHVTIVHQTKDLHEADYTQLYDFLKFNQVEVNELRKERLARTHDPLAPMENSNNPFNYSVFHQDQPSQITYMQQPLPNNNYIPQPSFNLNYIQPPMLNPKDISDPITAMNMTLVLMAKAFKLNYSTSTNNN
ncbi:hypothetical protein Tco_0725401 [Tanacetum coccineum]|uniref:Uncharacterized protein n=1 Tax=Tanacetum coccineum TaxID=301880 RepID=A0ABQ4YEZ0_9ASTR